MYEGRGRQQVCCQIGWAGVLFTSFLAASGVMAEKKEQTGASWENLPLPDEYPEPHQDDKAVLNGDSPANTTGESTEDRSEKGSPDVLQMLKAAESKWTPHAQDTDGPEASRELVAEAQRTDMVS